MPKKPAKPQKPIEYESKIKSPRQPAEDDPFCPKCDGRMSPGFIADNTHGGWIQSQWFEGSPELNFLGTIKIKGEKQLPVHAWRCAKCGYLELYAGHFRVRKDQ